MKKGEATFGKPEFSAREKFILRLEHLAQRLGYAGLKWRYRDRIRFGPDCKIDWRSVAHCGLGAVELGRGVIIERGFHRVCFHLDPESLVTMGDGCWLQNFDSDTLFSAKPGAKIEVGERSWFSGGLFGATQKITIGSHTLVGRGCIVLDSDMHRMDNDSPPVESAPVTIGSHVWLPSYIVIRKGVTIGDHCVIGTGSLVTESIPPNSFAAGRPAKVIKKIGDRDLVE